MKLSLTGVLDDGTPWKIPNPRTTIQLALGGSSTIEVFVVRPNGTSVVLAAGSSVPLVAADTMVLTVKKTPSDSLAAITKTVVGPASSAVFSISPADTKLLTAGRYVFDVWLTQAGVTRDPVIPLSTLLLEPAATPAP